MNNDIHPDQTLRFSAQTHCHIILLFNYISMSNFCPRIYTMTQTVNKLNIDENKNFLLFEKVNTNFNAKGL